MTLQAAIDLITDVEEVGGITPDDFTLEWEDDTATAIATILNAVVTGELKHE